MKTRRGHGAAEGVRCENCGMVREELAGQDRGRSKWRCEEREQLIEAKGRGIRCGGQGWWRSNGEEAMAEK